jgi:site-specific DNA-methyltransferase (adenine-specific)
VIDIRQGDCLDLVRGIEDGSVDCVVTSPPYWGLRSYGIPDAWGLESTLDEHLERLIALFREIRRVLATSGSIWLVYGDAYSCKTSQTHAPEPEGRERRKTGGERIGRRIRSDLPIGCLHGMPWRIALALVDELGLVLRQDVVWAKPNPMPESVGDSRCTRSHEYVFHFVKRMGYYWDRSAMREPAVTNYAVTRNRRDVWTVPVAKTDDAHFAVFPERLIRPMVIATCPVDGLVLDPFSGTGTVGRICAETGRGFIGFEINGGYVEMARKRCSGVSLQLELVSEGMGG